MADPGVGSWQNVNIFAMIRALVNNGCPIVTNAGAPTSGSTGTYNGVAGPGTVLIDFTNKNLYMNTNTLASPTWTLLGGAGSAVLTSPVLSGTVTGTYTLGGTPSITSPTITGTPVISTLASAFSPSNNTGFAADTYLVGSPISMPAQGFTAGMQYRCRFDMAKTGAGTAAFTVTVRIGTAGTTSDAAILTLAFGAGTAAIDTGMFELNTHFRTVGSGTSAVLAGMITCDHLLAATGLTTTGAGGFGIVLAVSSGFDSTIAATKIGISLNGGASFSGTNTVVEATLNGY